jgi:hypothetical protein
VDLRRVRFWDWIAGIAGAVLIGSMFLHWYSVAYHLGGIRSVVNAWQAFAVSDIFILVAGLFGIAIVLVTATQRTASLAQAVSSSSVIPVFVGTVIIVVRALDPPSFQSIIDGHGFFIPLSGTDVSRDAGLWIGLGSVLILLVACWRAMGDQSFPAPARSRVEVTQFPAPEGEPQ